MAIKFRFQPAPLVFGQVASLLLLSAKFKDDAAQVTETILIVRIREGVSIPGEHPIHFT